MFPGILAVQGDEDHVARPAPAGDSLASRSVVGPMGRSIRVLTRKLRNFVDQIVRSVVPVPGRVGKADQVRKGVVAKEAARGATGQTVGPVVGARIAGGLCVA